MSHPHLLTFGFLAYLLTIIKADLFEEVHSSDTPPVFFMYALLSQHVEGQIE